ATRAPPPRAGRAPRPPLSRRRPPPRPPPTGRPGAANRAARGVTVGNEHEARSLHRADNDAQEDAGGDPAGNAVARALLLLAGRGLVLVFLRALRRRRRDGEAGEQPAGDVGRRGLGKRTLIRARRAGGRAGDARGAERLAGLRVEDLRGGD